MKPNSSELFDRLCSVALASPDKAAIVDDDGVMTYLELIESARKTRLTLHRLGVKAGDVVGIPAKSSRQVLAAICGIFAAGAAYVAVDADGPVERNSTIRRDAGVAVTLTRTDQAESESGWSWSSSTARNWGADGDRPAYIVFTSGSTGAPKGVLISHRSLLWYADTIGDSYRLLSIDRVLHATSLLFDVSVEETWPTLLSGATIVLPPRRLQELSFDSFTAMLEDSAVTVCNLPSSYFAGWAQSLKGRRKPMSLRLVVVGSEPLSPRAVESWWATGDAPELINAYGLSESTITSMIYKIPRHVSHTTTVPVGRPIDGVGTLIVDEEQCVVEEGAVGELLLNGPGLAMAFTDHAVRDQKLIQRVEHGRASTWLRTGDIARVSDGLVEIVGRVDDQLKLSGFRIEPGEITAALMAMPEIADARVGQIDGQLAAFIVGDQCSDTELVDRLSRSLPTHAMPRSFVWFDAYPVLAGGKVDIVALHRRAREIVSATHEQRRLTLKDLESMWMEAVDMDHLDRTASFFECGGTSMKAAILVANLRKKWGIVSPIAFLFEHPRFDDFAASLGVSN